jgi:hypothetical protein
MLMRRLGTWVGVQRREVLHTIDNGIVKCDLHFRCSSLPPDAAKGVKQSGYDSEGKTTVKTLGSIAIHNCPSIACILRCILRLMLLLIHSLELVQGRIRPKNVMHSSSSMKLSFLKSWLFRPSAQSPQHCPQSSLLPVASCTP